MRETFRSAKVRPLSTIGHAAITQGGAFRERRPLEPKLQYRKKDLFFYLGNRWGERRTSRQLIVDIEN